MSHSRRRMMVVLCAISVLALFLSGCQAAKPKNTKVEIFSWWTSGGEAAGLQALIDKFTADNPG